MAIKNGTKLGPYEILGQLGAGGMGEVYLAYDQRLKRQVALKVLHGESAQDPAWITRFKREATSAAALNHPNICTVYDIGEADGQSYISMEYVEGKTLRENLSARTLSNNEILDIAIQIADALDHAHTKGIVHRDIKSANIVLTARNQVKILDFGLAKYIPTEAKPIGDASTEIELTQKGAIIGTAAYMSPEQALGLAVDGRTDLFSFGVVIYEMLTGIPPFKGRSMQELIRALLYEEIPSIEAQREDVPARLTRVVQTLLAKKPEDRYQSAHQVWTELHQIREQLRGATTVPASESRRLGSVFRKRWLRGTIAGLSLGVLVAILLLLWPKKTGLVTTTEAASVVALPAKVFGAGDAEFLTDAIPSTISTYLGGVEGLETKVPPTSVEVEQVHGDLSRIADVYGVKACVLSTITAEGERLVLGVQLIDTRSRRVLWSQEYEGRRSGYLELTRGASEGLRGALRPHSSSITASTAVTTNPEAELSFRRGQFYSNGYNNRHKLGDYEQAMQSFAHALELDPRLADAAAEIAFLQGFRMEAAPSSLLASEIGTWAERAVTIDPRCGKGWMAQAMAEGHRPRPNAGKRLGYAIKAAFFAPHVAIVHLAVGKNLPALTLALVAFRESHRLDPLYLYAPLNIANSLALLGRPVECLAYIDQILAMEPDHPITLSEKAVCLAEAGRPKEAAGLLNQLDLLVEEKRLPSLEVLLVRHLIDRERGDVKAANSRLGRILVAVQSPDITGNDVRDAIYTVLPSLTRHGMLNEAFQLLAVGAAHGFIPEYDWLLLERSIAPLREDPRFASVATPARAAFEGKVGILNAARARGELPKYLEQPLSDLLTKLAMKGP